MNEAQLKETFGMTLKEVIIEEFEEQWKVVIDEYIKYQEKNINKHIELFKGAAKFIKNTSNQGYNLGIVTSRVEYTTMKILEMYDLKKYFSSIITADNCKKHKPNPEPLLKCMNELNSKKNETIYVGDTVFDIECAKNSEVKSVLVKWNKYDYIKESLNADYEITSYKELYSIIEELDLY